MNLVNEGVLPPDELDDRDERREEQERARSRETVADIVEDIRERAENAMRNGERLVHNEAVANMLTFVADRLEAAWKRDEERAVEHATRHAEAVARDNCRDCVHNPRGKNYEGGNAAAMREALSDACYAMFNFLKTQSGGYEEMAIALDKAKAALSAPPRNCDAGTPEEQSDRFADFCDSHSGCSQCPAKALWNFSNGHKPSCGVLWAQMPYKAEEGGAK